MDSINYCMGFVELTRLHKLLLGFWLLVPHPSHCLTRLDLSSEKRGGQQSPGLHQQGVAVGQGENCPPTLLCPCPALGSLAQRIVELTEGVQRRA